MLKAKNPAGAIGVFEQAVSLDEWQSGGWIQLGQALGEDHRPDEALSAVRRALSLEPWSLQGRKLEALLLVQQGGDAWKELLRRRPVVIEANLFAAARLIERHRSRAAITLIDHVLQEPFEACWFRDVPRLPAADQYRHQLIKTALSVRAIASPSAKSASDF